VREWERAVWKGAEGPRGWRIQGEREAGPEPARNARKPRRGGASGAGLWGRAGL